MDFRDIIIRKMYRLRTIGGKHTAVENLTKSIPKHLVGDAKKAVKDLLKDGLIIQKQTSYGLHVSLNPEKIDEIMKIAENEK